MDGNDIDQKALDMTAKALNQPKPEGVSGGGVIHELKTWLGPFAAIQSGEKRHEVRVNDRNFQPGDQLLLKEWDEMYYKHTGREILVNVTHLTIGGAWGLPDNLCVMSIEPAGLPNPESAIRGMREAVPCTDTLRKIAVDIQPRHEGAAMTMFAWADNLDAALSDTPAPEGGALDVDAISSVVGSTPAESTRPQFGNPVLPPSPEGDGGIGEGVTLREHAMKMAPVLRAYAKTHEAEGRTQVAGSIERDARFLEHLASSPSPENEAVEKAIEALEQIAKGEGRFSRDQLTHANNTVEDMKAIAVAALAALKGDK